MPIRRGNVPLASDWTMGCHPFSHEVFLPMSVHLANSKMDQYLNSLGLFRYHLPVDGSCLFRAVSEVLFGSQIRHVAVRRLVCNFILENRPLVVRHLDKQQSLEAYVQRLRESAFPGNNIEMHVLGQLFHIDFVVYYRADREPTNVTQGGYKDKVTLCWSHGKQYDLVYTKERLEALTVSQAIVYNVLYKDVFALGGKEVDFAVTKMLYDKEHFKNKRHLTFSQWCNSVVEGEERNVPKLPETNGEQIVLAVCCGVPPFPFKVAKCLDPNLFRNVDYLNWCEEKRDEFRTGNLVTPALDTGVKCTARIGLKEHTGFVQSIDTKTNRAQVFLQSIGEIRSIPLSNIESSPVSLRVVLPSHSHVMRSPAAASDENNGQPRTLRTAGPAQPKGAFNVRRSFSTGDAVTAEQLEHLLRKQHLSTPQQQRPPIDESTETEADTTRAGTTGCISTPPLDVPSSQRETQSGSEAVPTASTPRAQTSSESMDDDSQTMTPQEDLEMAAKYNHCRRKLSLPTVSGGDFVVAQTCAVSCCPSMNDSATGGFFAMGEPNNSASECVDTNPAAALQTHEMAYTSTGAALQTGAVRSPAVVFSQATAYHHSTPGEGDHRVPELSCNAICPATTSVSATSYAAYHHYQQQQLQQQQQQQLQQQQQQLQQHHLQQLQQQQQQQQHYHQSLAIGEYPLFPMNPLPVVPIAQFNPSVPPPNYGTIPALHSLITTPATPGATPGPSTAATTAAEWLASVVDTPEETIEPGFTFRGPPATINAALIEMSQLPDGADLPLARLDIIRYFFNLGVAVYRSRRLSPDDNASAAAAASMAAAVAAGEAITTHASCGHGHGTTTTYLLPVAAGPSSTGYQVVPQQAQGTVIYQQSPLAGYSVASTHVTPMYAGGSCTSYPTIVSQATGSYVDQMQAAAAAAAAAAAISTTYATTTPVGPALSVCSLNK